MLGNSGGEKMGKPMKIKQSGASTPWWYDDSGTRTMAVQLVSMMGNLRESTGVPLNPGRKKKSVRGEKKAKSFPLYYRRGALEHDYLLF